MSSIILFLVALAAFAPAQNSPTMSKTGSVQKSDLEKRAIVNLRRLAMAESAYAMSHPQKGFACDIQVLTTLEWPDSPNHAKLLSPASLHSDEQYKLSAKCAGSSKPVGAVHIFAIPDDSNVGLRTFCATGTFGPFETRPYVRTSEFPIHSVSGTDAESCLRSGEPLK